MTYSTRTYMYVPFPLPLPYPQVELDLLLLCLLYDAQLMAHHVSLPGLVFARASDIRPGSELTLHTGHVL